MVCNITFTYLLFDIDYDCDHMRILQHLATVLLTVCVIAAKELIQGLLNTDPDKRFSIEDVMACKWIAVSYVSVCCTVLYTCSCMTNVLGSATFSHAVAYVTISM